MATTDTFQDLSSESVPVSYYIITKIKANSSSVRGTSILTCSYQGSGGGICRKHGILKVIFLRVLQSVLTADNFCRGKQMF